MLLQHLNYYQLTYKILQLFRKLGALRNHEMVFNKISRAVLQ